ncbi:hypothetical protein C7212DRAFT_302720 [Tuber magnatum]|uniref:UBC core domain-containing protein n=1 Tax=Tuber magnatum TaxID=42249 RepID=A0A317SBD4_9PEZI|nr:hypothetical protein C7212DRAFT_302720 [Tuber magnatum]
MEVPKPRPPAGAWDTLFLEDTCYLKESPGLVGVISKTWHEPDDEWDDEPDFVPGHIATENDMNSLLETGQPPRHFAIFEPLTPSDGSILVHESEVKVVDRSLAFGDVVKRNLKSPISGTVISVSTEVSVQHSFQITSEPSVIVTGIPEAELYLAHGWSNGDLVIYKGCWIGVVEEIVDEVVIRLENGSFVVPEDSAELEIPVLNRGEEAAVRSISSSARGDGVGVTDPPGGSRPSGFSRRTGTVPAPAFLSPGFTVATSKANIRRGRWLYGAYNPNVPPTGVVVAVKTTKLGVRWLRQNSMVTGRFIPVERPSTWLELEEVLPKLKRFCRSTGGFVGLDGAPYTASGGATGGGTLQVGDRVRFKDLPSAAAKYPGVLNISRSEAMGFDINTFGIVSTLTRVRVLWQDMTETVDNARDLKPYLNVDEQEVWPGEIVMLKLDHGDSPESLGSPNQGTVPSPANAPVKDKVGVVQRVNPRNRVASVKWFKNPVIEFSGDCVTPGFKSGELGDESEDVSVYEVMDLETLSVRRGDFVTISPDYDASPGSGIAAAPAGSGAGRNAHGQIHPLRLEDIGRTRLGGAGVLDSVLVNALDNNLLMNLSAALGASSDPQLQGVGRQLNQIPFNSTAQYPQRSPMPQNSSQPRTPYEEAYLAQPIDWLGEVVDMGVDGLVTVRLGALDVPRDIRVSIDRLFIVFNDDMDFDDISDEEIGDLDDDQSFGEELDSGSDWSTIANSQTAFGVCPRTLITENVCYEGDERLGNREEEDWPTDDVMEVDGNSSADIDTSVNDGVQMTMLEHGMETDRMEVVGKGTELAKDVTTRTSLQQAPFPPNNTPAPEAFSIPGTSEQPARFAILDTPVPSDHAFVKKCCATSPEPTFLRRMHKEHQILSTSLPDGIIARGWESRLDLLRVLIIGPMNTPYELAPFFFDFYFPDIFPQSPPIVHFHSWTGGVGRINPNLYEDGKVCLSLLGTWHAEQKNEAWSARGSTVLQVLVSLMGLVLVREPYYNEAGFGVFAGADEVSLASALYSEKAYILSRGFVKHVLETPMSGFEEEIKWLYLPHQKGGLNLLEEVIGSTKGVVKRSESEESRAGERVVEAAVARGGVGNITPGALILLKRNLQTLERIMERASRCL